MRKLAYQCQDDLEFKSYPYVFTIRRLKIRGLQA